MSRELCGYCGKQNGWHNWGCPNLDLRPLNRFRPLHVEVDDDEVVMKPFAEGELVTLPEVE